ncbi:MAG TPA: hypothetical protein VF337_12175 [Candidatus Limnocylindrales bacterium]
MSDGQTPEERLPDRPGEQQNAAPIAADSTPETAAAPVKPKSRSTGKAGVVGLDADVASRRLAAAAAAAGAVSLAMAANAAAKSEHPAAGSDQPAAKVHPPVVVEGYVRPPGRDIPGIIRAHRDETEPVGTPLTPLPLPPRLNAEEARYMRPDADVSGISRTARPDDVPNIPGITRASITETVAAATTPRPAPIFSNEGALRESSARRQIPVIGAVAGFLTELLGAGVAFGHSLASHGPGSKSADAGSILPARDTRAPDFDRYGNPRPTTHRRLAMLLISLAGILIIGLVATSLLLLPTTVPTPFTSESSPSSNPIDNFHADASAGNSGPDAVVVGDDSMPPDAVKPHATAVARMPLSACAEVTPTPKPTPTPTPTPTPAASPSASESATAQPTPTPTPTPVPTPCYTPAPRPKPTAAPTGTASPSLTASPSASPTITPVPTPTAAVAFVEFLPAGTVIGANTATYTAPAGTGVTVMIAALSGSTCKLTSSAPSSSTKTYTDTQGAPPSYLWMVADKWGTAWKYGPAWPADTYTVTATCTLTGYPTVSATQQVVIT